MRPNVIREPYRVDASIMTPCCDVCDRILQDEDVVIRFTFLGSSFYVCPAPRRCEVTWRKGIANTIVTGPTVRAQSGDVINAPMPDR